MLKGQRFSNDLEITIILQTTAALNKTYHSLAPVQTRPPSHPALVHSYLEPRLSHFPSSWLQMIGAMRARSQALGGRRFHARSRRSLDELRRRPQEVCQRRFDSLRSAAVFGPRGQVNETQ